jgi:hypothetical protein
MSDIPIITDRQILANRPDTALHDKKEKTCLLIDIAILDYPKVNNQEPGKLRFEDRGQQDVESDDKNCASYNRSIRNNCR